MSTSTDDNPLDRHGRVSDLVDVRHLSLAELRALPESILSDGIRRVYAEIDGQIDVVAGFQSSI